MGIPKYFKYIVSNFSDLTVNAKSTNKNIENLFLDMNCLIHPCVKNIVSRNYDELVIHNKLINTYKYLNDSTYNTPLELKIYQDIINYVNFIVDTVKPTKLLYLAIDGIAPVSKMYQQRYRRYKSILEKELNNEVLIKHSIIREDFDTNCITPGTIFMYKLSTFLRNYIDNSKLSIKIILDDAQNIGEGEHKIFKYMKTNNLDDINSVYGLDADLIMLSMVSNCRVYLLREDVHFGISNSDDLLYLDVELFKDKLFEHITTKILENQEESQIIELNRENIIKDYIVLCFLIGNDFLPSIVGIDISNDSINDILAIYIDIFKIRQKYLVEDNKINFIFLRQIFNYLYSNENEYLISYQEQIDNKKLFFKEKGTLEKELEKIKYYPIFNKNQPFRLGEKNWMDSYYKYYFNIGNIHKNQKIIENICKSYIDGLQWTLEYYLNECPSYYWYYPYRVSPCLRELCKYMIYRIYPTQFSKEKIFNPFEQLAIVLPLKSRNLWAKSYNDKLEKDLYLKSFYPIKIKLDTVNKHFLYECNPILPYIDIQYIRDIFSEVELNEFEKSRSEITGLYVKE